MPTVPSLTERLARLYPSRSDETAERISSLVDQYRSGQTHTNGSWTERDIVLITYADQIGGGSNSPLANMATWLHSTGLDRLLSTVHLLPFCPWSSDDGFSVIDYLAVDPAAGTWDDIAHLREQVDLMFDLVLNHISRRSDWFERYTRGEEPYRRYFLEVDDSYDTSQVVRPRSLPLLTEIETANGPRRVWTTFSDDQIDLNYAEPDVLVEMLRVLLEYARRGARIIRLDAVAFLWKADGTNCVHLPQTHEVVKLMREVVEQAFPGTLLLTETNVPHAENISYFGGGDEAHMVYQFSLPPLLIDAFVHGDALWLRKWLAELAPPPAGCTFFNFTASHDGVGVRPLEGLVPDARLDHIVAAMRDRGGLIGTRRQADGTDTPYELNVSYVDALSPTTRDEPPQIERHAQRFLASQAVMLALQGMPAVYIHSLTGSQNDYAGVESSGINRRINRRKFQLDTLHAQLAEEQSLAGRIFAGYQHLLATRRSTPAFHPNAPQRVIADTPDHVLAFIRTSLDATQQVLVVANFAEQEVTIQPGDWMDTQHDSYRDLLGHAAPDGDGRVIVPGECCAWIVAE